MKDRLLSNASSLALPLMLIGLSMLRHFVPYARIELLLHGYIAIPWLFWQEAIPITPLGLTAGWSAQLAIAEAFCCLVTRAPCKVEIFIGMIMSALAQQQKLRRYRLARI